ncbi:MAG: hypothetical protein ACTHLO_15110 [Pseudolabrys sp.]
MRCARLLTRSLTFLPPLLAALALGGCVTSSGGGDAPLSAEYLTRYAETSPTPASFIECHGFGCAETSRVSLTAGEWAKVKAQLSPPARDARAERGKIAHAVATMQKIVGAKTGTGVPQWTHRDMMILPNLGDPTQLDCIDEAVNTWTYMTMMERAGLFRFHSVADLGYAGLPADTNPRNTAVLREKSGALYAVDASLTEGGEPPYVMPLSVWAGDWPPRLADIENAGKAGSARPARTASLGR